MVKLGGIEPPSESVLMQNSPGADGYSVSLREPPKECNAFFPRLLKEDFPFP